jgi:hypothetical protein
MTICRSEMATEFIIPKGGMEFRLKQIAAFLSALSKGRAWRIKVEELRMTRSIQQLRYLNGVAYKAIGSHAGFERDDVSEFCNGTYFGWKRVRVPKTPENPTGFASRPIRTTTTDESGNRDVLSKVDFIAYVDFVIRFAASKGIHVPAPNEEFDEAEEDAA